MCMESFSQQHNAQLFNDPGAAAAAADDASGINFFLSSSPSPDRGPNRCQRTLHLYQTWGSGQGATVVCRVLLPRRRTEESRLWALPIPIVAVCPRSSGTVWTERGSPGYAEQTVKILMRFQLFFWRGLLAGWLASAIRTRKWAKLFCY